LDSRRIQTGWNAWKTDMLEQHVHDERLKLITERFGKGPS
jgi:hypothetical protein